MEREGGSVIVGIVGHIPLPSWDILERKLSR